MSRINVKVSFNRNNTKVKLHAANEKALFIVGQKALMDSNAYAPSDQGGMINGSLKASEFGSNVVSLNWSGSDGAVYARYQWHGKVMKGTPIDRTYGPENLKYTKEAAQKEWAKYAQKKHDAEWQRLYESALKEGLKG